MALVPGSAHARNRGIPLAWSGGQASPREGRGRYVELVQLSSGGTSRVRRLVRAWQDLPALRPLRASLTRVDRRREARLGGSRADCAGAAEAGARSHSPARVEGTRDSVWPLRSDFGCAARRDGHGPGELKERASGARRRDAELTAPTGATQNEGLWPFRASRKRISSSSSTARRRP